MRCASRLLLLSLALAAPPVRCAVVQKIWGANDSQVLHASCGGGTHVYFSGANIGTAFAPPTVLLGLRGQLECTPQPFTSGRNRVHCIVSSENTPAPSPIYEAAGAFVSMPMRVYKGGQLAKCWHGGGGDACAVRFDCGATPRILRVLTQSIESGGLLRLSGQGIDGGLVGAPLLAAAVYRGAVPIVGTCGEKDCQASNAGAETVGCTSRPDAGGDGVTDLTQQSSRATAFSDARNFGCALETAASVRHGGFFNVSLSGITDPLHRGNAYLGFLANRLVDVAAASPFSVELVPRITDVSPRCAQTLCHPALTP